MPQSMASQPPALAFLHASRDTTHFKTSAGAQGLPHGPLRRMAMGFAAISATAGPLRDVTYRPLELGPWCHQAPLWGNPFLTAPLPSTPVAALNAPPCVSYGTFLDDVFYRLMQIPSLVYVADAPIVSRLIPSVPFARLLAELPLANGLQQPTEPIRALDSIAC
eukprot:gene22046-biopygen30733